MNKVQKGLDSWCREVSDEEIAALPLPEHVTGYITYRNVYFRDEAMFKTGAVVFSGVTGISDSALEIESGELYFSKEGVNEENFLDKANSLLNAITDRSKKLEDIMSEYSYNQHHLMDKLKERLESADRLEKRKVSQCKRSPVTNLPNGRAGQLQKSIRKRGYRDLRYQLRIVTPYRI